MKHVLFSTVALSILGAFSCKKGNTEDQPQWVDVTVSGTAFNADGNTPLVGKTISVDWGPQVFYTPGAPIPQPTALASTVTNSSGRYEMTLRLDARQNSSIHNLYVWMPIDTMTQAHWAGWLYVPRATFTQPTSTTTSLALNSRYVVDLPIFQRAMLTIRQHRAQTGPWQNFFVGYGYPLEPHSWDGVMITAFHFQNNGPIGDSSITVPTLANVYTKLPWRVTGINGYIAGGTDSIRCTVAGPNEYTINW